MTWEEVKVSQKTITMKGKINMLHFIINKNSCLSRYTLRIGKSDWQKIPAKNI